jgi:uncharacterized membrane protein YiaA
MWEAPEGHEDAPWVFSSQLRLVRPPTELLVLAGTGVGISGLLLLAQSPLLSAMGYLFGCVLVVCLIGVYRLVDQRRSNDPDYSPIRRAAFASGLIFVCGLAVASVHVWRLATELSR